MSDFDFDEIDKAVAGATSIDANPAPAKTDSTSSAVATPEPVVAEQVTETPRIVLPAARRNSGRFMDVVHPSSDMRSRTSPALVNPTVASDTQRPSFVPPVTKTEEAPEEMSDIIDDATVGEWSQSHETPFLADAKVEKRPLGGVGPEPQILLDAPEEELLLEETSLPDPIDFAAQVEALASESEDTGIPVPVEELADEQTIEQLDELKEPEPSAPPVLEVKTSEEPIGPTSISQQYTEQPATQQESGAIYDTENYHQPIAPVAKTHSGVWTVVWVLLLVILGAAAGVAFYLFVLPRL